MKQLTSSLIALALVASLPAVSFARPAWSNTQGLHEAGDIVGTKVQNADGKDIGKVDALLIDPKDGKVSHVVVGLGGVLGLGKDKVVLPYSALKMSGHEEGRRAKISVDASALDTAPKYVKARDRAPSASPSMGSDRMPATNPATSPKTDKSDKK